MRKVIIPVGLSGIGKSTYIKNNYATPNCLVIETDAIREELCGNASDQSKNSEVFKIARQRFKTWLGTPNSGQDICILDATNLTVKERNNWYNIILDEYQMEIEVDISIILVAFKNNIEKALKQNKMRKRQVQDEVIKKQSSKYTTPTEWEMDNCHIFEAE